jgi:uncharacterized metal-binding protein YceD (DUF177 family)
VANSRKPFRLNVGFIVNAPIGYNRDFDFYFQKYVDAFKKENITESGLLMPEDAQIDLQPLVREYAILEFPINPLCRKDCQGLCMECGQNLNEKDCGHKPEIDSPFLALKDLFEKYPDKDEAN